MASITFLGGEETGDVAYVDWRSTNGTTYRFHLNQPVECDDKHIVAKASANRFFAVDGVMPKAPPPRPPVEEAERQELEAFARPDPLAKARAAKAAKRAAALAEADAA